MPRAGRHLGQISTPSRLLISVHTSRRYTRPLEGKREIFFFKHSRPFSREKTKPTKLKGHADDHADEECPLSNVERIIAYLLNFLVGRAVDATLDECFARL